MNARVSVLPVEIDVAVPIRKFRVRDLLTLKEGVVIASQWIQGDDMPLAAPGAQLAWTEFGSDRSKTRGSDYPPGLRRKSLGVFASALSLAMERTRRRSRRL